VKLVYIAGPFTGSTAWQIECNVRRAENAGLEVARLRAMPVIPHANTRYFHGELDPEFWYEGTAALLARCDAALFIGGWTDSKGCVHERDLCHELGIPMFFNRVDLERWLTTGIY
jgi:hypothetical protein